jgi:hypothetical protein
VWNGQDCLFDALTFIGQERVVEGAQEFSREAGRISAGEDVLVSGERAHEVAKRAWLLHGSGKESSPHNSGRLPAGEDFQDGVEGGDWVGLVGLLD